MVSTRSKEKTPNGHANGHANGQVSTPISSLPGATAEATDYSRWRLQDEEGRHTWHYLKTDQQVKEWPQSLADKYHLGLPTVCLLFDTELANICRICLIFLLLRNHPNQSTTVFNSTRSSNSLLDIGLVNMEDHSSSCQAS